MNMMWVRDTGLSWVGRSSLTVGTELCNETLRANDKNGIFIFLIKVHYLIQLSI